MLPALRSIDKVPRCARDESFRFRFRFPLCFSPALLYFSVVLETQTATEKGSGALTGKAPDPFPPLPPKPNLRPAEIAKFLDVSTATIYELIDQGEIPSLRVGRQLRIPRERFVTWYRLLAEERAAT